MWTPALRQAQGKLYAGVTTTAIFISLGGPQAYAHSESQGGPANACLPGPEWVRQPTNRLTDPPLPVSRLHCSEGVLTAGSLLVEGLPLLIV